MVSERTRRVVTYERVSSEDQRERETIKTQTEQLARRLEFEAGVELVSRYVDDGVSGTVAMSDRPAGFRLLADARRGLFDEVWVYKIDRLGRDDVDPLVVWRELESLGVTVRSVTEGVSSPFEYHIRVAMAAEERRAFLARSAAGMERALREGRYPGGIVPFGYKVEGERHTAFLVVDERPVWGSLTAAELSRWMFVWSFRGWSDRRVADELNALGVPTAYAVAGRGIRGKSTQKVWRPNRVGQILTSTTYYGEYRYGKRSARPNREVVIVNVPPIVSKELWDAVHGERSVRGRTPLDERRRYLLRSLIRCEVCGLNYTGTVSHGEVWYRCNGALVARGPLDGRCHGKGIKEEYIAPTIRQDIERLLRNPGELICELETELARERETAQAIGDAEQVALEAALAEVLGRKDRLLDLYLDSKFDRCELDRRMGELEERERNIRERLDGLERPLIVKAEPVDADLLFELQRRLDVGLTEEQWRQIVSLLVQRIRINTTVGDDGHKEAKAVVEYRFDSVVEPGMGRGSSPPPA